MSFSVNLLPWRYSVRQRRRRYRLCIMVSLMALLISGYVGAWIILHQQMSGLQKQESELEEQQRMLQDVLYQQQDQQQYRGSQPQHHVFRWQQLLTKLANELPENSWLTTLNWQPNRLILEGYTSELDDLEAMETLLKQLPGALRIQAGPVSYLAEQGLAYTFIMEGMGGVVVSP